MKISKAEVLLLSLPFESGGGTPPWDFGGNPASKFDALIVRVEADNGLVGWGEAFSRGENRALADLIEQRVLPKLIGRNPQDITLIKYDVEFQLQNFGRIGGLKFGVAAVDIALWDLLGKSCGASISTLLGGRFVDEVTVYASFVRYDDADKVTSAIERAVDRGYRYVKLHEVYEDIINRALEVAKGRVKVALDINCGWDVSKAIRISNCLRDEGIVWLEEPIWPPEDYAGLAQVRKRGSLRIASGENISSLHDFSMLLRNEAVDIAQPDVTKTGGITEMQQIATLCEAMGTDFIPHCTVFGPGQVANVHICASRRLTPFIERLFIDFDAELYGDAMRPKQGVIRVPTGPGLGLEPNQEVLERYVLSR